MKSSFIFCATLRINLRSSARKWHKFLLSLAEKLGSSIYSIKIGLFLNLNLNLSLNLNLNLNLNSYICTMMRNRLFNYNVDTKTASRKKRASFSIAQIMLNLAKVGKRISASLVEVKDFCIGGNSAENSIYYVK